MKIKFLLLFLTLGGCAGAPSPTCPSSFRAVIDLGSGSTKMNMAEIETCDGNPRVKARIDREESRAVALEAAKNKSGEIPEAARLLAIAALTDLRKVAADTARARGYKEYELAVVGTHAVRTAQNRAAFLAEIAAAGFSVRALTQDEEGQAGYLAVSRGALPPGCDVDRLLVWDVGGGSAQFTTAKSSRNLSLGAESYRKNILGLRQNARTTCPVDKESPNPLGKNLSSARQKAARAAPVLDASPMCVVGIGGVHNKAVQAAVEKNWSAVAKCFCGVQPNCRPTTDGYTKKEVECLANALATKTDCDPALAGPYARTAVSNLALVLGFMDRMKVERVHTRPVNMGDFYLLDSRLQFAKAAP